MALPLLEDIDTTKITLRMKNCSHSSGNYKGYTILYNGGDLRYTLGEVPTKIALRDKEDSRFGKQEISVQIRFEGERGQQQIEKMEAIRFAACKYAFENFRDELDMPDAISSPEDMFKMNVILPVFYRKKGAKRDPNDKTEVMYLKTFDNAFGNPTKYQMYETAGDSGYKLKNVNPKDLDGQQCVAIVQCSGGRFTSHAKTRINPIANRIIFTDTSGGLGEPEDDPTFAALVKNRQQVVKAPSNPADVMSPKHIASAETPDDPDEPKSLDRLDATPSDDSPDDDYMDLSNFKA